MGVLEKSWIFLSVKEWEPWTVVGLFSKPIQDRRVSPAMVSKGSICATMQQDTATSRIVNGNSAAAPGTDTVGHMGSGGTGDGRGLQQTVSRGHNALPLNHQRATPNSDDTSDPDAMSNTSFDVSTEYY